MIEILIAFSHKIKIQKLEYIPTYNTYEKVVNKVYWNYEATKDIILSTWY